jgi:hypothetical protein
MKRLLLLPVILAAAPLYAAEPAKPLYQSSGQAAPPAAPAAAAQPQQAPATGAAATTTPAAAVSTGTVARAQFTNAIQDREPADNVTAVDTGANQIYYFTELRGMAGQTVAHRWEHDGKVMFEQKFDVGSDRWRTYSSKSLYPNQAGEWKASVIDAGGATLSSNTFNLAAPAPAATPATPPAGAAPGAPATAPR